VGYCGATGRRVGAATVDEGHWWAAFGWIDWIELSGGVRLRGYGAFRPAVEVQDGGSLAGKDSSAAASTSSIGWPRRPSAK
jgi:hypothetical protein